MESCPLAEEVLETARGKLVLLEGKTGSFSFEKELTDWLGLKKKPGISESLNI